MTLTDDDRFLLKLTAWRENRGAGENGMQSVMNVILNRAAKRGESVYDVCTDRLQFSSVSTPGDPETALWSKSKNPADWAAWLDAARLVAFAVAGSLEDLTGGATDYYAVHGLAASEQSEQPLQLPTGITVPFPRTWDRTKLKFTRLIGGQAFFVEV